jgi:predicted Rossmann fold flavoprotein
MNAENSDRHTVVVVGGGAAGYFAAIACAEAAPKLRVILLERAAKVLGKVKISGGGRCNVCHAEYDPRELVKSYPRGSKALLGPFHRFCSGDTQGWFESRGVALKTEPDGRMFPVTDSSQTIIDCLTGAAAEAGVEVFTQSNVTALQPQPSGKWSVSTTREDYICDRVLLAPGSNNRIWDLLADLGHHIVPPVPSLFTLNIKDERLQGLPGIATEAEVRATGTKLHESGPLLVTHWGLSGPAVLRLSAWGARILAERKHQFELRVNWVPGHHPQSMEDALRQLREAHPRQQLGTRSRFDLPGRLWKRLVEAAGIPEDRKWAETGNAQLRKLAAELCDGLYQVAGKSTFKEEFVTAGGVRLSEVNFRTMESKLLPGLYLAGEILDIDAITGGFNFQAAWTTGWIAGQALAEGPW